MLYHCIYGEDNRTIIDMATSPDNVVSHAKARSLRDAVNKVRSAETERADGISELHEAERARLDMLVDELSDVFKDAAADERMILQVASGAPPRLWIDVTSHVMIGRDRRTYRFLKDTHLGRTIIMESDNLESMADRVTDYIAERVVEFERALEGGWVMEKALSDPGDPPAKREKKRGGFGRLLLAFVLGAVIGIGALVTYAWFYAPTY